VLATSITGARRDECRISFPVNCLPGPAGECVAPVREPRLYVHMRTLVRKAVGWFRGRRRALLFSFAGACLIFFALLVTARVLAARASAGRIYEDAEAVPARRVALVLGCAKNLSDGRENLFFRARVEAAAALYRAGKVQYLLASGDNHVASYDEPADMADALAALGVPRGRIVRDCAGFSTLDSVVRAKAVFGAERIIVVSQEFHNRRALLIARAKGLDAVALNAADPGLRAGLRTMLREQLALVRTLADLTILQRQPRFYGPPVEIGATSSRIVPGS